MQTLSSENTKALSKVSLGISPETDKEFTMASVVPSSVDNIRENGDRIDSGFESMGTKAAGNIVPQKRDLSDFHPGKVDDNEESHSRFQSLGAPWEIFVSGRKLSVSVYHKIPRYDEPAGKEVHSTKANLPPRSKPGLIKPVLRVELVHPAVVVSTHTISPRIQMSCFDVNITGVSLAMGKRQVLCSSLVLPCKIVLSNGMFSDTRLSSRMPLISMPFVINHWAVFKLRCICMNCHLNSSSTLVDFDVTKYFVCIFAKT